MLLLINKHVTLLYLYDFYNLIVINFILFFIHLQFNLTRHLSDMRKKQSKMHH